MSLELPSYESPSTLLRCAPDLPFFLTSLSCLTSTGHVPEFQLGRPHRRLEGEGRSRVTVLCPVLLSVPDTVTAFCRLCLFSCLLGALMISVFVDKLSHNDFRLSMSPVSWLLLGHTLVTVVAFPITCFSQFFFQK